MKKNKRILFIGLKNDEISNKMINILKKNFLYVFVSNNLVEFNKYKNRKFDLVFNFRSKIILKKKFLINNYKKVINFHPGTEKFRGIGCANFALIKNSKSYGAICHFVNEKIDNGQIIDVRYFRISKKDNLNSILKKSYKYCFEIFSSLIKEYLKNSQYFKYKISCNRKIKWSKKLYTKKDMLNLYNINLKKLIKFNKNKFDRLFLATKYSNYKLILNLHNKNFKLIQINEKK